MIRHLILTGTLLMGVMPDITSAAITNVLAKIDRSSGKPTDTATVFTLEGIISARATLPDGSAVAVLEDEGGLPVLLPKEAAAKVRPRDAVKLSGKLKEGQLGFAVLAAEVASVSVTGTNNSVTPTPRGAADLKDASAFAGGYTAVTNVTFDVTEPKFTAGKFATAKDPSGAVVKVYAGQALDGRAKPTGAMNLFGVVLKFADGWAVLPARFLPVDARQVRALATKYTCITCHQPEQRLIGPAYRDVAVRYKDDPEAVAKLVAQMENGGTGKWGAVSMLPFKGRVTPDEMKTLAHWIMDMRWDTVLGD
jgi:cytochrome c551/c552